MNVDKDFPMLNKDIIYFDNSATTLKPKCVIDAIETMKFLNKYHSHFFFYRYFILI